MFKRGVERKEKEILSPRRRRILVPATISRCLQKVEIGLSGAWCCFDLIRSLDRCCRLCRGNQSFHWECASLLPCWLMQLTQWGVLVAFVAYANRLFDSLYKRCARRKLCLGQWFYAFASDIHKRGDHNWIFEHLEPNWLRLNRCLRNNYRLNTVKLKCFFLHKHVNFSQIQLTLWFNTWALK